eukprot:TRINITY_DN21696_c2_g1_i2.p1 TRINITY_DN21696_c2_g1~~TRINITY_DN21696_c2_g1_i2.p1  ORF type:complete len:676 (+),score=262.68 TRINITY_DN21696_c2_g1_i2:120-2147(+)
MRETVSIAAGGPVMACPGAWSFAMLSCADLPSRLAMCKVNRAWHRETLGSPDDSPFWAFMEDRLAVERALYRSPVPRADRFAALQSAKGAFLYAYNLRDMWGLAHAEEKEKSDGERAGETFKIRVCARFRPEDKKRIKAELETRGSRRGVVLPLHQRIQGIKRANGITDTAQAARLLMKEREEGEASASVSSATSQVLDISTGSNSVMTIAPGVGMRAFTLDAVFRGEATQRQVYIASGAPIVRDFINGTDACCIVFGQTGSGKTHTMFGEGLGEHAGIVPQACAEVFDAISQRQFDCDIDPQVAVAYIEVFGDEVCDLLSGGDLVMQNRSAAHRWVLEGRAQHAVSGLPEALALLEEGDKQKRRAATLMNERSSRAHTLYIMTLQQTHRVTGVTNKSMLVLADLGGSEDTKRSGAAASITAAGIKPDQEDRLGMGEHAEAEVPPEETDTAMAGQDDDAGLSDSPGEAPKAKWAQYYRNRQRMQEAIHINMGLLALKNCVRALHARQGGDKVHVPYQDSKLTNLLSGVLGGKASTCVVVTGSPFPSDAVETINTLRFGEDCRAIETSGSKLDATARAIKLMVEQLDKDIATAQDAYQKSEQWVKERVKRKRAAVEEEEAGLVKDGMRFGADGLAHEVPAEEEEEEVDVYRMRGGEAEGAHLEELLSRRRKLLGCA